MKIWRRAYAIPPPELEESDERFPGKDPRYAGLPPSVLPKTESLSTTVDRVLPFWSSTIAPAILSGKKVLIAAHGNSLRALVKYLDGISDDEIVELNIPTGGWLCPPERCVCAWVCVCVRVGVSVCVVCVCLSPRRPPRVRAGCGAEAHSPLLPRQRGGGGGQDGCSGRAGHGEEVGKMRPPPPSSPFSILHAPCMPHNELLHGEAQWRRWGCAPGCGAARARTRALPCRGGCPSGSHDACAGSCGVIVPTVASQRLDKNGARACKGRGGP